MTAATLIIAAGVLAALPFRRAAIDGAADPADTLASGPRGGVIDPVSTRQHGQWPSDSHFDPSLAWQPVPMVLPKRSAPELPPMPDSYYDLAFELEQPDPIRQRFSATVQSQSETGDPAPAHTQLPAIPVAQRSGTPSRQPADTPANGAGELTAEDLIQDRFVYTPIAPPKTPLPLEPGNDHRSTPAQSASLIRSGATPSENGPRQRHFIREPH